MGRALSNPDLKGSTFVVAGHTDAAGGEAYNQDLSERRADSIKRYLVDKFGIAGTDLVTVGYGKTKLKDPANPLAEVNRRVQVVEHGKQGHRVEVNGDGRGKVLQAKCVPRSCGTLLSVILSCHSGMVRQHRTQMRDAHGNPDSG